MAATPRMPLWTVVLMHAVPAVGVIVFGWSIALVLLFYWVENLVNGVVWLRAIRRHHAATRMRGHYRNQLGVSSNDRKIRFFPDEYRAGALFFTGVHGVFVFAFAFALLDGQALLDDLPWVVVLLASSVFLTWQELKPVVADVDQRSFAWLRLQARRSLYPVHAMHLGIIFGAWTLAADEAGRLLVLVFIALRIVADVFRQRPEKPPKPPQQTTLFGGRIRIGAADDTLERQQQQRAEDELPMEDAPPAPLS